MINLHYIAPSILMILCLFSLWSEPHYLAGAVVLISQSISFLIDGKVSLLYSEDNLYGGLGVILISAIVSFAYLGIYDRKKHKILFKMGITSLVFTILHFLYVITWMPEIRALFWYNPLIFDQAYHQYQPIQFILYLYMITLFGRSGIMGIYHGVFRFFNFIRAGQASSINHRNCGDNRRVSSDVGPQGRSGRFKENR